MSKGLERLNNKNLPCSNCKELKAIEIIRDKNVNTRWIRFSLNYNYYISTRPYEDELTEEEYDLLKEVML